MFAKDTALLREVLSLWTAPFREGQVAAFVRRFAAENRLCVSEDRYGNLSLRVDGAPRPQRPWVITAHMDHPAFVTTSRRRDTVHAQFLGGVRESLFEHASVCFDTGGSSPSVGRVEHVCHDAATGGFKVRIHARRFNGASWTGVPVRPRLSIFWGVVPGPFAYRWETITITAATAAPPQKSSICMTSMRW